MPARPISFLSDFGHADEFVGVVHGVVARISPDVRVIDVAHEVPRGDVMAGALALTRAIQYLPSGVALAVVDPGVGSARRPVAVATRWGEFVGPDNGLLAPAVAMVGGATEAVVIEHPEFRLPTHGSTFDGRDVFAPAAAVLASGEASLGDLGGGIDPAGLTPLLLPLVEADDTVVNGQVWWVDGFGNAQTNVQPGDLERLGLRCGDLVAVRVGATLHELRWGSAYEGERPLLHVDAHGLVAIAVPGGRADEELAVRAGVSVGFRKPTAAG